ncbi:MAG: DNA/RNA non-specific endonuclease [Bacteroidales bacterium]|nr:DNA/RNA non-specific endonuclease [Bacteroidales bacterium]
MNKKNLRSILLSVLLIILSIAYYAIIGGDEATENRNGSEIELTMAYPAINESDYIIEHNDYTISYDSKSKIPEWVAYELTPDMMGNTKRTGKRFQQEDLDIPQAKDSDYTGSGYTRGHMAPAADFSATEKSMWETFYLTNCCPQTETMNNGCWQDLEKKVRSWAKRYGSVYVVSGPIIGNSRKTIGSSKVVVPESFFKALLANDNGNWKTIAFIMDNDEEFHSMDDSAVTINELERITGLDFFPSLDDSIEETVEDSFILKSWGLGYSRN